MGLLDNYTGIGMSPRPSDLHQRVIGNLIVNLRIFGSPDFDVLPEAPVTADRNDLTPDVVVRDMRTGEILIAIEITTHRELKAICNKCMELVDRFPLAECWVFDYEKEMLYFPIYNEETELVEWQTGNDEHSQYYSGAFLKYFYRNR